jgi:hypothetical protein
MLNEWAGIEILQHVRKKNIIWTEKEIKLWNKRHMDNKRYYVYSKLDVHKSVHRDTTMKITNKMHYID